MIDQLKPCPFCGGNDMYVERADNTACFVICNDCQTRGPIEVQESDDEEIPGHDGAITAWNRRPPAAPAFTDDEARLLDIYRSLEPDGRRQVDTMAQVARDVGKEWAKRPKAEVVQLRAPKEGD